MMLKKCGPGLVVWLLVTIGALNWGLSGVGYFAATNLNLVNKLVGTWPAVENGVYILVGLAGIASFFHCKCKKCNVEGTRTM